MRTLVPSAITHRRPAPAPAPARAQHQYHTKIDDLIERTLSGMVSGLVAKLVSVLEAVIAKLGRYDEGSLIGSILSFTVSKRSVFFFLLCISLYIDCGRWLLVMLSPLGNAQQ